MCWASIRMLHTSSSALSPSSFSSEREENTGAKRAGRCGACLLPDATASVSLMDGPQTNT